MPVFKDDQNKENKNENEQSATGPQFLNNAEQAPSGPTFKQFQNSENVEAEGEYDDLDDEEGGFGLNPVVIGVIAVAAMAGLYAFMSSRSGEPIQDNGYTSTQQQRDNTQSETPRSTGATETPVQRTSTWQPRVKVDTYEDQQLFDESNISDITRQIIEHAPEEQNTAEFFTPTITVTDEETGETKNATSNGNVIIVEELPPAETTKLDSVDLGGGVTMSHGSEHQAHAEQNLSKSEAMDNASVQMGLGVSSGGEAMWAKGKTTNSMESTSRVLIIGGSTDGVFSENTTPPQEETTQFVNNEEVIAGDTIGAAVRGVANSVNDTVNDAKRSVVQGATEAVVDATVGNGIAGTVAKKKLGLD